MQMAIVGGQAHAKANDSNAGLSWHAVSLRVRVFLVASLALTVVVVLVVLLQSSLVRHEQIARMQEQEDLRLRYHTHLNRVTKQLADSTNARPVISMVEAKLNNAASQSLDISEQQAKDTIAAAKLRSKIKKLEKQLSIRDNAIKQEELNALKAELTLL